MFKHQNIHQKNAELLFSKRFVFAGEAEKAAQAAKETAETTILTDEKADPKAAAEKVRAAVTAVPDTKKEGDKDVKDEAIAKEKRAVMDKLATLEAELGQVKDYAAAKSTLKTRMDVAPEVKDAAAYVEELTQKKDAISKMPLPEGKAKTDREAFLKTIDSKIGEVQVTLNLHYSTELAKLNVRAGLDIDTVATTEKDEKVKYTAGDITALSAERKRLCDLSIDNFKGATDPKGLQTAFEERLKQIDAALKIVRSKSDLDADGKKVDAELKKMEGNYDAVMVAMRKVREGKPLTPEEQDSLKQGWREGASETYDKLTGKTEAQKAIDASKQAQDAYKAVKNDTYIGKNQLEKPIFDKAVKAWEQSDFKTSAAAYKEVTEMYKGAKTALDARKKAETSQGDKKDATVFKAGDDLFDAGKFAEAATAYKAVETGVQSDASKAKFDAAFGDGKGPGGAQAKAYKDRAEAAMAKTPPDLATAQKEYDAGSKVLEAAAKADGARKAALEAQNLSTFKGKDLAKEKTSGEGLGFLATRFQQAEAAMAKGEFAQAEQYYAEVKALCGINESPEGKAEKAKTNALSVWMEYSKVVGPGKQDPRFSDGGDHNTAVWKKAEKAFAEKDYKTAETLYKQAATDYQAALTEAQAKITPEKVDKSVKDQLVALTDGQNGSYNVGGIAVDVSRAGGNYKIDGKDYPATNMDGVYAALSAAAEAKRQARKAPGAVAAAGGGNPPAKKG